MDKQQKDLMEKQHKELITILLQGFNQIQETRKLLQNFYNDFLFYNQKPDITDNYDAKKHSEEYP